VDGILPIFRIRVATSVFDVDPTVTHRRPQDRYTATLVFPDILRDSERPGARSRPMGTRSDGNGNGWPPDGLPDLPPEWGTVIIPDDPSELAQESARIRREIRRHDRQLRWRRRLHLPPPQPPAGAEDDAPSLGIPLLVISIAVIATLVSLFAIAWPAAQPRPGFQPTAVVTTSAGRTDGPSFGNAPAQPTAEGAPQNTHTTPP